jgi:hypothetical protein
MFAEGPHLEQVVERGRQVILERLSRSVLDRQPGVSLA